MKIWLIPLIMSSILAFSSCTHPHNGAGTGAGILGGALAGSLVGPHKNRAENALIGAAVGGLLGSAVDAEAHRHASGRNETGYVATYPTTQYIITEPVYYRESRSWSRHRHHHHWDRHRHHHRHGHWRNWD
ncbi:MAG: YMGG-like glycine zipper-containing protein [Magnetococcus sp. MYC-9]